MKVDVSMTTDKEMFEVQHWWAREPAFVVDSLRRQLAAAAAVWPELRRYAIVERPARAVPKDATAQAAGGHARAAALTPTQRREAASKAARARWATTA